MNTPNDRLLDAVQRGDLDAARRALDEGADPNHAEADEYRSTPVLFTACKHKNLAMVQLLLERGATADDGYRELAPWGSESTPNIYIACPHVEIMRALLEKGADPNAAASSRDDVLSVYPLRDHQSMTAEIHALLGRYGARSPRMERFDPDEARPFHRNPTAAVNGRAARRTPSGDTIAVAGEVVRLVPATRYSTEEWEREVCRGERLEQPDSRAAKYERKAKTSEEGQFRFAGLTAGDYFVICRVEEKSGERHECVLGARVTVRERETLDVALAEIAPHDAASREGTAVVTGVASVPTPGGGVAVAARRDVYLIPVTEQSEALWQRVVKGELPRDPEGMLFERRTPADEGGRFRFEPVRGGDYFVCCLIETAWEVTLAAPSGVPWPAEMHQKVLVGARTTVRDGETAQVELRRIR